MKSKRLFDDLYIAINENVAIIYNDEGELDMAIEHL